MKTFYISALAILLFSCSSSQKSAKLVSAELKNDSTLTDKETGLFNQQKEKSYVSIVGPGGELFKQNKTKFANKKKIEKQKQLSSIEGLNVTIITDEKGNSILKGTLNNDIVFDFNSFELTSGAKLILDKIKVAIANSTVKIDITGFTDNVGKPEYNIDLSAKRAKSVADYLSNSGVDANNIKLTGKGAENPIESNVTPEGRAKNRRVEILFNYQDV